MPAQVWQGTVSTPAPKVVGQDGVGKCPFGGEGVPFLLPKSWGQTEEVSDVPDLRSRVGLLNNT